MLTDFVHIDIPRWMTEAQTDELGIKISDIIGDGIEAGTDVEQIKDEIRNVTEEYFKTHQP